jgi:hypothetical protein
MDKLLEQETVDRKAAEDPNEIIIVGRPEMLKQLSSFVYVNGTELASNNWDVRIALGERLPNGSSEARIGIVMSHQHFKAFVQAATTQLTKLEQLMGEIHFEPVITVSSGVAHKKD